jgi:hypothetical protein
MTTSGQRGAAAVCGGSRVVTGDSVLEDLLPFDRDIA